MELYGEGNTDIAMEDLISELSTVSPEDSIATLLDEFLKKREHIFLVVGRIWNNPWNYYARRCCRNIAWC